MATPTQPVAGADTAPSPDLNAIRTDYENQINSLKNQAAEAEERFQGIKSKLDEVYKRQDEQRKKTLEDQGQWKDLWEEANRTAQEKDQQINDLQHQLEELRQSNENAAIRTKAMAAISQAGAINAEQMLQLVQTSLRKSESGNVVVLNGGVEQDLTTYLSTLKSPGSGFEHHFKPSAAAGMGAKPTSNVVSTGGVANPWKEGSVNLTQQMLISSQDPDLAAVLKREAGL